MIETLYYFCFDLFIAIFFISSSSFIISLTLSSYFLFLAWYYSKLEFSLFGEYLDGEFYSYFIFDGFGVWFSLMLMMSFLDGLLLWYFAEVITIASLVVRLWSIFYYLRLSSSLWYLYFASLWELFVVSNY